MMVCSPLQEYMTPSDLAFAIVVIEHYIIRWQLIYQTKVRGEKATTPLNTSAGLLYDGGIAGREAKKRFDSLLVYVYENFYNTANQQSVLNMTRLQVLLDAAKNEDPAALERDLGKVDTNAHLTDALQKIQNDVVHRVFYYMYV